VATGDETLIEARTWRTQHGAIPGPMEVWLAHRSLPTLPVRVSRQCATAQQLAGLLASWPMLRRVTRACLTIRSCRRETPDGPLAPS
jgi:cystathionine beta-lyase/cystathionine gamma-synthase